jgi:hypothetical protein
VSGPRFAELWTADFPFSEPDTADEKHRTVLVLGYNQADEMVAAVKITSSNPRSVYSGQFGLYRGDSAFTKSGLQKDSKFDFQVLAHIPFSKFTKRIGMLDIENRQIVQRMMAAIKASKYADEIARIGRDFG